MKSIKEALREELGGSKSCLVRIDKEEDFCSLVKKYDQEKKEGRNAVIVVTEEVINNLTEYQLEVGIATLILTGRENRGDTAWRLNLVEAFNQLNKCKNWSLHYVPDYCCVIGNVIEAKGKTAVEAIWKALLMTKVGGLG